MVRPELKEINCPFMRTMLSVSDAPKWDSRAQLMNVEDLLKFAKDQPGSGNLDRVLRFFSVVNHGVGNRVQRLGQLVVGSGQFSTVLKGSDGDHDGDSGIYDPETGEFDAAQFQQFTSFSRDGETMDVATLGQAIADANRRHGGSPMTAVQSAGEFGLLCILIGDDAGTITVADMRRLFETNEFPDSARKNLGSRTAEQWLSLTRKITEAISAASLHAQNEMKAARLKNLLEVLFSPLLTTMHS